MLLLNDRPIGYYAYYVRTENEIMLDNLFVLAEFIGKGYGRLLMDDFLARVKKDSALSIILYSDPHSEEFYDYYGFKVIGKKESSIPNRYLPIMELELS
ncbi:GNAT family N-acetyltransferase [Chitinophagales bacterium]|nr:GNAT family N-acetyltransferase [Chitinophagales bacterium]